MVEVNSKKPLIEAIQNSEQHIRITDSKFLLACWVAEECENDKNNIKKLLDVAMAASSRTRGYNNNRLTLGIVGDNGRIRWMPVTVSTCATALGIIDILNDTYAKMKVERDERGNLTGNVDIL